MTDHISSLISLAEQSLRRLDRMVFLPVFHDFGDCLFHLSAVAPDSSPSSSPQQQNSALRSLIEHLDTSVQRMRTFNAAEQDAQLSRPNWIYKLVLDSMIEPSQTEFPGPMCVPLTRSNLNALRYPGAKYLVCEKSDGLRAIMVSVALPRLPRWFEISDVSNDTESTLRPKLNLRDIALLEHSMSRLMSLASSAGGQQQQQQHHHHHHHQGNSSSSSLQPSRVQLSIGTGSLQLHEYRDDLFWFEPPPNMAAGSNQRKALLRRVRNPAEPRYATFFLDRSMTAAFMLLDDMPMPTDLAVVVADGELLLPALQQHGGEVTTTTTPATTVVDRSLIYTTFDIFSTAPFQQQPEPAEGEQQKQAQQSSSSSSSSSFAAPLQTLKKDRMSSRYQILLDKFVAPLQQRVRDTAASRRNPLSVSIVRKEMVPMSELPALLRRLSRDPDSNMVLFDGSTPNDGLIFTPDRFDLTAGSRMDQFKWKWADSLSVDWVVKPIERVPETIPRPTWADGGESLVAPAAADADADAASGARNNRTSQLQYVELFWFFRRRAARGREGEQDVFGHSFAGHAWLWNPDGLAIEPQYLRSFSGMHSASSNAAQHQHQHQRRGAIAQAQQRDVASEGGTVVECSLVPMSAASCMTGLARNNSFIGVWRAERVRRDKNCANAATAVLSVLESVSENLGVVELLQELAPAVKNPRDVLHASFFPPCPANKKEDPADDNNDDNDGGGGDAVTNDVANKNNRSRQVDLIVGENDTRPMPSFHNGRHELSFAHFLICVVAESGTKVLRLQWSIKLATKTLQCNYREVSECVAMYDPEHGETSGATAAAAAAAAENDDDSAQQRQGKQQNNVTVLTGSRLEGILTLALANDGGCIGWSETCVRSQYDPGSGRWIVEQVQPGETNVRHDAYGNQILKHLLFVIGTKTFAAAAATASASSDTSLVQSSVADLRRLPPFVHHTVPIRDTSSTRNTSRHYDEIANFMSGRTASGAPKGAAAAAAGSSGAGGGDCLSGGGTTKGRGIMERSSLRKHQNWVKQVLLSRALEERGLGMAPSGEKVKATLLDLCSGRGGDLLKYSHTPLKFLLMIDASFDSSVEAARRYCNVDGLSLRTQQRGTEPGVRATFAVADCFDDSIISDIVRQQVIRNPNIFFKAGGGVNDASSDDNSNNVDTTVFDLVSCQFSLHYSCSSEKRLRGFLRAVATSLCVGGVFFGTTVDERVLAERRAASPDKTKFGNDAYSVEFVSEERARQMTFDEEVRSGKVPLLSEGYLMHMSECVQGALEYVVPFDRFTSLALEEGLVLVEEANFKDFFEAHRNSALGRGAFASARMGGSRRGRGDEKKAVGKNVEADEDAAANASEAVPILVDFGLSDAEKLAAYLYRVVLLRKFR